MNNLLPYSACYENSRGEVLRLDRAPVVMTECSFFDSSWKLSTANRPLSEGGRLTGRKRPCQAKAATLEIAARSASELSRILADMAGIFDYDTERSAAGKLFINGSYLSCWCVGRTQKLSSDFVSRAQVELSVYPEFPAWCTEKTISFYPGEGLPEEDGHRYPFHYPKRYGSVRRTLSLHNGHFSPSPLRIVFYGPVQSPRLYLSGNCIGINVSLSEGEYAVIDQRQREIYKVSSTGEKSNCFGSRMKTGSCFKYAPSGTSEIEIYSGIGVDVTLIEQRSEPEWSCV